MPRITSAVLKRHLDTQKDRLDAISSRLDLDLSDTDHAEEINDAISALSGALDDTEQTLEELDEEVDEEEDDEDDDEGSLVEDDEDEDE